MYARRGASEAKHPRVGGKTQAVRAWPFGGGGDGADAGRRDGGEGDCSTTVGKTTYIVPVSGIYDITAWGAQGGAGGVGVGGEGAEIGGHVSLTAGDQLTLLVGGSGGPGSGGGGGGGGALSW